MYFSKRLLLIMIVMLTNVTDVYAGDKEDVMAAIDKFWKQLRSKSVEAGVFNPSGTWMATSQGGLWQFLSPTEAAALFTESATTLDVNPSHVNVQMLGSGGEVGYAMYYVVGNIRHNGKIVVNNYRTRISQVFVKVDGVWTTRGTHASPLFSGAGIVFE